MKKIIFLWGVILVILSVALVSYAKMEKIAISKDNLAELKGNWVGTRTIGPGRDLNTDLEILNDTLPVQSKFILSPKPWNPLRPDGHHYCDQD